MGGIVHETYPAAGYMLNDTLTVGLLTDAGNRNLWTRNIRRRPSKQGEIGFRAIREICDANLIRISNKDERLKQNNFVKYTFGEVSDFNHPIDTCLYPVPDVRSWKPYHDGAVKKYGDIYEIEKKGKDVSGVRIPYYLTDVICKLTEPAKTLRNKLIPSESIVNFTTFPDKRNFL